MIVVTRIDDIISVSYNGQEKTVAYSKEKFNDLLEIADTSAQIDNMDDYQLLVDRVIEICKAAEKTMTSDIHPDLFKDSRTGQYHLRLQIADGAKKEIISSVPMPDALVRRIEESIEKGISIDPVMKNWIRFLRNKKASNPEFAERYFNYIDMTYILPDVLQEKLDEGYSYELAEKLATTYQVKLTSEGLINCFKVSSEIDWTFKADVNGYPEKASRYAKTFDPVTGKITGDDRDTLSAEDRVFIPAIQKLDGDAFFCEGAKGSGKEGHEIRVGAIHRLADWSMVNCNDNVSCVKGLHVGGLNYIANYSGVIHNVFIDPMHIGAIPDDKSGAMRCIQYFVHSSLIAINTSIFHSSDYAKKTDEQWNDIKAIILKEHGELKDNTNKKTEEYSAL